MSILEKKFKEKNKDENLDEVDDVSFTKINELVLDGMPINELTEEDKKFLEKFVNLSMLSMNGTGLVSLKNFPKIDSLEKLFLNSNNIKGNLDILSSYINLRTLEIEKSRISKFEDIQPLTHLEFLNSLSLADNPIVELKNYRSKLFEIIPDLCILDHKDSEGNDVEENSDEEGDLSDVIDDDEEIDENDPEYKKYLEDLKKSQERQAGDDDDEEDEDDEIKEKESNSPGNEEELSEEEVVAIKGKRKTGEESEEEYSSSQNDIQDDEDEDYGYYNIEEEVEEPKPQQSKKRKAN